MCGAMNMYVYSMIHIVCMHTIWYSFAEYSLFCRALLQKRPIIYLKWQACMYAYNMIHILMYAYKMMQNDTIWYILYVKYVRVLYDMGWLMCYVWISYISKWYKMIQYDTYCMFVCIHKNMYGVALVSRIDKITGLFCKRAL